MKTLFITVIVVAAFAVTLVSSSCREPSCDFCKISPYVNNSMGLEMSLQSQFSEILKGTNYSSYEYVSASLIETGESVHYTKEEGCALNFTCTYTSSNYFGIVIYDDSFKIMNYSVAESKAAEAYHDWIGDLNLKCHPDTNTITSYGNLFRGFTCLYLLTPESYDEDAAIFD